MSTHRSPIETRHARPGLRLRNLAAAALVAAALAPAAAWAGKPALLIHPTKVMLEGRTRGATIQLINRGDATGTFEIGMVDYRMTEAGGLSKPDGEAAWSLQPHVRFSPRRVTLPPGGNQAVKIALRPQGEVQTGEYWSHLKVVTVTRPDGADDPDVPLPAASVIVNARAAMAIPIVWRNTRSRPEARIHAATLDSDAGAIQVDVERVGDVSVRGTLRLVTPSGDVLDGAGYAEDTPLVIYPNIGSRRVSVPLTDAGRMHGIPAGTKLVLASEPDARGRDEILATFPIRG